MSNDYSITTENLTKEFDGLVAVNGIDLAVKSGEIFGLVGPDGAGKTTTLRLLTTLLRPTSGKASVGGFDTVTEATDIRKRIGYISETFNLYGDLTVIENLNFFARLHEIPSQKRDATIKKLLAFSRLEEFTLRRGEFLSGGMQKKLALACALIPEPQILFLDEPTTGVDPVSRRDFWNILSELRASGVTLFITTPYMDEAERCNTIAFMQNGRIHVLASPEEIKDLLTEVLVEIRVANPRSLIKVLREIDFIISAEMFGERIEAVLDADRASSERLLEELASMGFTDVRLEERRPSMESAFVYLVKKEEEAHQL